MMPNPVNAKIHLEDPVDAIVRGGYEIEAINMLLTSFQSKYASVVKERAECVAALNALKLKGA